MIASVRINRVLKKGVAIKSEVHTMIIRRSTRLLRYIFFICIWLVALNIEISLAQTQSGSLIGSCERAIHLYDLTPGKVISNEIGYTVHYKFEDEFPSKRAFSELQHQLEKCGWKPYNGLEFVVNDPNWTNYLKDRVSGKTVMVHRFGRTYSDPMKKRLASILLIYYSVAPSLKETMMLDKPNNRIQHVTIQFMPFNEKEYRKKMDEYKQSSKPK